MVYKYNVELTKNKRPKLVREEAYNISGDLELIEPALVYKVLCTYCRLDKQAEERVMLLALDTAGHILGIFELSHGTVAASPVSAREIFLRLLACGASCFILAHNHPSGSLEPSKDDKEAAASVKQAADIMYLKMLDFIIVSDRGYYSFCHEKIL